MLRSASTIRAGQIAVLLETPVFLCLQLCISAMHLHLRSPSFSQDTIVTLPSIDLFPGQWNYFPSDSVKNAFASHGPHRTLVLKVILSITIIIFNWGSTLMYNLTIIASLPFFSPNFFQQSVSSIVFLLDDYKLLYLGKIIKYCLISWILNPYSSHLI